MSLFGQVCLLMVFIASGYAAFAAVAGRRYAHRGIAKSSLLAGSVAAAGLTAAGLILGYALVSNDLRFEYVTQHSSALLPWPYRLSSLWVGQAGSLLVWAWLLAMVALGFRLSRRTGDTALAEYAFGILMAYLSFLAAILVFAADPLRPAIGTVADGSGFSPLLLHPAMLVHPPVVFLGYAACGVPFALAVAALASGRLDAQWALQARRWTLFGWAVLGAGILIGAWWAYAELGWGGYWSWDPVENGSLLPWLTATALVHCLLAWRRRGALKTTAIALAVATFGLCNFATFVTRSGVFASLHAFGQSPIGWAFLLLMVALALGGAVLIAWRRAALAPQQPLQSLFSRESLVALATVALLLLAAVTLVGTLSIPLAELLGATKIVVGSEFYSYALIPIGLLLLMATAVAPLTAWGTPPSRPQRRGLGLSLGMAALAVLLGLLCGLRRPLALIVAGTTTLAFAALMASIYLDARRRRFAGLLVHASLFSLALGITGSSLATQRREVVVQEGETIQWAGRSIRFVRLHRERLPDKFIAEAELEIDQGGSTYCLRPAQHYHLPSHEWTTEVAIHSTWTSDFYTILHPPEGPEEVRLSLIENPLMRWLWAAGWMAGLGALLGIWPGRRRAAAQGKSCGTGGLRTQQRARHGATRVREAA